MQHSSQWDVSVNIFWTSTWKKIFPAADHWWVSQQMPGHSCWDALEPLCFYVPWHTLGKDINHSFAGTTDKGDCMVDWFFSSPGKGGTGADLGNSHSKGTNLDQTKRKYQAHWKSGLTCNRKCQFIFLFFCGWCFSTHSRGWRKLRGTELNSLCDGLLFAMMGMLNQSRLKLWQTQSIMIFEGPNEFLIHTYLVSKTPVCNSSFIQIPVCWWGINRWMFVTIWHNLPFSLLFCVKLVGAKFRVFFGLVRVLVGHLQTVKLWTTEWCWFKLFKLLSLVFLHWKKLFKPFAWTMKQQKQYTNVGIKSITPKEHGAHFAFMGIILIQVNACVYTASRRVASFFLQVPYLEQHTLK